MFPDYILTSLVNHYCYILNPIGAVGPFWTKNVKILYEKEKECGKLKSQVFQKVKRTQSHIQENLICS